MSCVRQSSGSRWCLQIWWRQRVTKYIVHHHNWPLTGVFGVTGQRYRRHFANDQLTSGHMPGSSLYTSTSKWAMSLTSDPCDRSCDRQVMWPCWQCWTWQPYLVDMDTLKLGIDVCERGERELLVQWWRIMIVLGCTKMIWCIKFKQVDKHEQQR